MKKYTLAIVLLFSVLASFAQSAPDQRKNNTGVWVALLIVFFAVFIGARNRRKRDNNQ